MSNLVSKIKAYKNGNENALLEIILQMKPLIEKYSKKLHFMDRDDATQELVMFLIGIIKNTDPDRTEAECLKYFEMRISGYYKTLCKKFLNRPQEVPIDAMPETSSALSVNMIDFKVSVEKFISYLEMENPNKAKILVLSFEAYSDTEISRIMGISRQYIHRIKKELLRDFMEK